MARLFLMPFASFVALLLTASASGQSSTTWHVDSHAAPGGDGLSWATAFASLDDGLAAAQVDDQVWVASGRYRPGTPLVAGDPRSASFLLPHDVDVYGGFAGHETTLAARAGLFAQTILSGDLGVPGDASDNAYHVLLHQNDIQGYHPWTHVDGFRITAGNADGGRKGGGVLVRGFGANAWPVLDLFNCVLDGNRSERGGAIALGDFSRLRMLDCTVADNFATERGGGLLCVSAWTWSYNTIWYGNTTQGLGGAVYMHSNEGGSVKYVNNVFFDNRARAGGAAYVAASPFIIGRGKFEGCTAAFNSASIGGAFYAAPGGVLKVWNSIVWDNRAPISAQIQGSGSDVSVQYSDVQGGFVGWAILDVDPRFVDPDLRNLRTLPGSPVRDAGSNDLIAKDFLDLDGDGDVSEPVPIDLDGGRRVTGDPLAPNVGLGAPPVDLGAYEG